MNMTSSEQSGFFKVVSSSLNMEIPTSYVCEAGGSLGKKWILRAINCKPCSVEVYRDGTRYFLRRGWSDFYTHNSLQEDDIIVFEHRAHNLFDVKIFGHNACEKGRKHPRKEEDPIVNVEDQSEGDYDEEEKDEEEEEEDPRTAAKRCIWAEYEKVRKEKCTGFIRFQIFKSGLATRPEIPFFVSRSRTLARRNELYIPKDVIEDYHLEFSEKLILKDEQGMKWDTKMKLWKDGRVWCTRGWKRLCRANNIGPNETCICEFVRGPGSELVKEICVRRVVDNV